MALPIPPAPVPTIYLPRRLLTFIPVLWATVTLVFVALRFTPGDPTATLFAEAQLTPAQFAARRTALGLDQPLITQYLTFGAQLLRGDLGASFFTGRPVTLTIVEELPPTAGLASLALGVALAFGLPLGVLAAARRDTLTPNLARALTALSQSLPVAWTGLLALWLTTTFAPRLAAPLTFNLLPALVLGFAVAGPIASVMRASLITLQNETFILAARARGVHGWPLLWHIARAALIPVVNITALQAAFLFGGTVVTETVFARPGLGRVLVDALLRHDFPVVQGVVLFTTTLYLTFNLIADLLAAALDPRLRTNS